MGVGAWLAPGASAVELKAAAGVMEQAPGLGAHTAWHAACETGTRLPRHALSQLHDQARPAPSQAATPGAFCTRLQPPAPHQNPTGPQPTPRA